MSKEIQSRTMIENIWVRCQKVVNPKTAFLYKIPNFFIVSRTILIEAKFPDSMYVHLYNRPNVKRFASINLFTAITNHNGIIKT